MKGKKNIAGPTMRRLRQRNGWTQEEFSKMLREIGWRKCTRERLARIEAGELPIRDTHLPFVYAVLGEEFCEEFRCLVNGIKERAKGGE